MKRLRKLIHHLKPYRISISDGMDIFEHKAWSWSESLAWASAYPTSWGSALITRRGRVVALRDGQ
jgi:beta-glucosidase/6-phospho-beta-glucosidase/beta-galactosidase